MEKFSALLPICVGNSPITSEFPAQRPVTRIFHVFFHLRQNKRLSKQWWDWWFRTPSRPLWRHCDVSFVHGILISWEYGSALWYSANFKTLLQKSNKLWGNTISGEFSLRWILRDDICFYSRLFITMVTISGIMFPYIIWFDMGIALVFHDVFIISSRHRSKWLYISHPLNSF